MRAISRAAGARMATARFNGLKILVRRDVFSAGCICIRNFADRQASLSRRRRADRDVAVASTANFSVAMPD